MSNVFNQNWLSTARRRAKEGILQAVGAHVATEDQEFDNQYKTFSSQIDEIQKMKQLMEVWVESLDTFCTATAMLVDAWNNFTNPSHNNEKHQNSSNQSPYGPITKRLNFAMSDVRDNLLPAIKDVYASRCLSSVQNILLLVPPINEAIQQRKTLMLDFDSYRSKIEKEHAVGRDATHPVVAKKAAKLDESAKRVFQVQKSICDTFNEFKTARTHILGPELAVFMGCFYSITSSMHENISKLLPAIPQAASTLSAIDAYRPTHKRLAVSKLNLSSASSINTPLEPILPVLNRSSAMGGAQGGYGVLGGISVDAQNKATEQVKQIREEAADSSLVISRPVSELTDFRDTIMSRSSIASYNTDKTQRVPSMVATVDSFDANNHKNDDLYPSKASSNDGAPPPPKPPRHSRVIISEEIEDNLRVASNKTAQVALESVTDPNDANI